MTTVVDLALLLPCPACGAEPTYWCVTYRPTRRPAGMLTTWLHSPRLEVVSSAVQLGCREGGADALEDAAWRLEARRTGVWWAERDAVPLIANGEGVEEWLRAAGANHRRRGY